MVKQNLIDRFNKETCSEPAQKKDDTNKTVVKRNNRTRSLC